MELFQHWSNTEIVTAKRRFYTHISNFQTVESLTAYRQHYSKWSQTFLHIDKEEIETDASYEQVFHLRDGKVASAEM